MANVHVLAGKYLPLGFEQITDVSSATALTVPTGARLAIIQATTQNVRWRDDGTSPSATVGMQLLAGASYAYSGNLGQVEIIEETASAVVNISYYA